MAPGRGRAEEARWSPRLVQRGRDRRTQSHCWPGVGWAEEAVMIRTAPAVWASSEDRARRGRAEGSNGGGTAATVPLPGLVGGPGPVLFAERRLMQQGSERLRVSEQVSGAAPGGAVPREAASWQAQGPRRGGARVTRSWARGLNFERGLVPRGLVDRRGRQRRGRALMRGLVAASSRARGTKGAVGRSKAGAATIWVWCPYPQRRGAVQPEARSRRAHAG